jgi:hypothetical protein
MIQAKCIQKFRDNTGRIYGYRLQDLNGKTQDVTSENLKKAIKRGQINIINLTLTSDYRLIDSKYEQLQSKVLGAEPTPLKSREELIEQRINDATKSIESCSDINKNGLEVTFGDYDYDDIKATLTSNIFFIQLKNIEYNGQLWIYITENSIECELNLFNKYEHVDKYIEHKKCTLDIAKTSNSTICEFVKKYIEYLNKKYNILNN